ncbi:hypothetical protein K466DRAFT_661193 [Polyporus arcularius HHB13444]|uniref:Uncharacterized protein n=1 Tax=Polyporus arcularius HHB13444 TaxID=1314778 RepID=A0A5C3PJC6_9APHY|nr:hypothetical protein K466DRAFT_661193 [Polyporus arcularius HHB13444]
MACFNKLSDDHLLQIFMEVRYTAIQEEDGVRKMGWLRLAEVCHRWAELMKTTPAMWSILHFFDGADSDVVDTFLGRSGDLTGLEVCLDFGRSRSPPSWSGAILDPRNAQRLGSLTIRWHLIQKNKVYRLIEKLQAVTLTNLTLVEDDSVEDNVVRPPRTFAGQLMEELSSATDVSTFVKEPSTDETTDGDELEDRDYKSQAVAEFIFRAEGPSSSDWESGSEEQEAKYGAAWDEDDSSDGYDGIEENFGDEDSEEDAEEESCSEESDGSKEESDGLKEESDGSEEEHDGFKEGSDGSAEDSEHEENEEILVTNVNHWRTWLQDRDRDTEEESDEINEGNLLQSPRTSDGHEDEDGAGDRYIVEVMQHVQLKDDSDEADDLEHFSYAVLPLPYLPALVALAISGLLFVAIHPANKPTLRSLAVLDTGKYGPPFVPGSGNDGVLDILKDCTNLEQLIIGNICWPDSTPGDRRVSLPHLQSLVCLDEQDVTRAFLPFLELQKPVFLHPEGLLHTMYRIGKARSPGQEPSTVFRNALLALIESSPEPQRMIEAIFSPKILIFRADEGFFVSGSSRDVDDARNHWHISADASVDTDTQQSLAMGRWTAFPAAIEEFSNRAIWRTDTVSDLEIHLAPCHEYDRLDAGLKDAVDAFQCLRRFVIGGEFAVCRYLAELRSTSTGWTGLEELCFCLLTPTERCFFELVGLLDVLGTSAALPERLVVRFSPLPPVALDPWEEALRADRCVDFCDLVHWYPTMKLDVSVIAHECSTCQRRLSNTVAPECIFLAP